MKLNGREGFVKTTIGKPKIRISRFLDLLGLFQPDDDIDNSLETSLKVKKSLRKSVHKFLLEGDEFTALQILLENAPKNLKRDIIILTNQLYSLNRSKMIGDEYMNEIRVQKAKILKGILDLAETIQYIDPDKLPDIEEVDPEFEKAEKILVMSAVPTDDARKQAMQDQQSLEIHYDYSDSDALRYHFLPVSFPNEIGDIQRSLDTLPRIVHFSGHSNEEGIMYANEQDELLSIGGGPLRRIFRRMQGNTDLIIQASCFSETQAKVISQFNMHVIGAGPNVPDEIVSSFFKAFYRVLGMEPFYRECYEAGIKALSPRFTEWASSFQAWRNGQPLDW